MRGFWSGVVPTWQGLCSVRDSELTYVFAFDRCVVFHLTSGLPSFTPWKGSACVCLLNEVSACEVVFVYIPGINRHHVFLVKRLEGASPLEQLPGIHSLGINCQSQAIPCLPSTVETPAPCEMRPKSRGVCMCGEGQKGARGVDHTLSCWLLERVLVGRHALCYS